MLAAQVRLILQQTTLGDTVAAAAQIGADADGAVDETIYSFLALAYYSRAEGGDRLARLVAAAGALEEGIRRNAARVAATATSSVKADHAGDLYIEYAGIQCAMIKASPMTAATGAERLEAALKAVGVPDAVKQQFAVAERVTGHVMIKRECGADLSPMVVALLSPGIVSSDAGADPGEVAADRISVIYVQIRTNADRAVAQSIQKAFNGAAVGPRMLGIEAVNQSAAAYRPSVRYYYADQLEEATRLRTRLLEEAREAGQDWSADELPLMLLKLSNPPDNILEVWLPEQGARPRAVAEAPAGGSLSLLEVAYFQRPADGLIVQNTLVGLLRPGGSGAIKPSSFQVRNPVIGGDRNNAIACSSLMSEAAFREFKALTLQLLDSDMPLEFIKSFEAPGAKQSANWIEIYHGTAPPREKLTRGMVEAMTQCPARGEYLPRMQ